MLILILIDAQYSQKAVFSFEKFVNCQNHISSGFLHLVKNLPHQNVRFSQSPTPHPPPTPTSYKNPGDGVQYLFKTLNFGNSSHSTSLRLSKNEPEDIP